MSIFLVLQEIPHWLCEGQTFWFKQIDRDNLWLNITCNVQLSCLLTTCSLTGNLSADLCTAFVCHDGDLWCHCWGPLGERPLKSELLCVSCPLMCCHWPYNKEDYLSAENKLVVTMSSQTQCGSRRLRLLHVPPGIFSSVPDIAKQLPLGFMSRTYIFPGLTENHI